MCACLLVYDWLKSSGMGRKVIYCVKRTLYLSREWRIYKGVYISFKSETMYLLKATFAGKLHLSVTFGYISKFPPKLNEMPWSEAPWTVIWWSQTVLLCGAFAVSEVPGVLFLSPWLTVRRAGCLGECCLNFAKDEGCQVLYWGAGDWTGLLVFVEFRATGCATIFLKSLQDLQQLLFVCYYMLNIINDLFSPSS